jgi:hypothetical protein
VHQHVLAATWIANQWSDVASIVSIVIAFVAAFRPELHTLLTRLEVDVLDCHRTFSRSFEFAICDEQRRQLLDNIDIIIAIVCKQLDPNTVPNSIFSKITIQS